MTKQLLPVPRVHQSLRKDEEVERCWLVTGRWHEGLLFDGLCDWLSAGTPGVVSFERQVEYVHRACSRWREIGDDVIGFAHTHPTFPATPSETDHATMRGWVVTLGKPLLCVIRGTDGLKAYCYLDYQSPPVPCVLVALAGEKLVGAITQGRAVYEYGLTTNGDK